ncbi:glycosyltransferase [Natrarchaeobius oligotrophus]|uniref:Glycosyltransferase n=1 Tax=Natrarchaeobius chitinivorans TaxID=1679083 RepID=A0A3N6MVG9_NATCH|nr:glycosyltransferase [Natrarchaeobius chitinivorans]RQH01961.1 glycosyltransferase [Natrarchaeobius chitinivorans]
MALLITLAAVLLAVTALPYVCYLVLYAIVAPSGSPAAKESIEPTVSVVLPTYNESGIVERKLENLQTVDYPAEKMELVVVDSSDDETPALVREYAETHDEFPALTIIEEEERRGLAPALNDAYEAAEGEIVVKTDCDSMLDERTVREAIANFADEDVDAVTGQNVEIPGGSDVESSYRGVQSHIQSLESHLDSTLIFHGPFSAFRNESIVALDPNSLADDTELALKIRRSGGRVIFDPAAHYKEAAHSSFRKRRTQKDRRAMGLIRLLVQHRDALFRYGRYGRIVLPFNWWFMIASPWLLLASVLAVTAAAVSVAGIAGASVLVPLLAFVWLGQADRLGPIQPVYAIFDTQVSLLRASVELVRGESDGTWEVDAELREAYE